VTLIPTKWRGVLDTTLRGQVQRPNI